MANELDLDRTTLGDLNQSGWFSRMLALLQPQSAAGGEEARGADARQDAQQLMAASRPALSVGAERGTVRDSRLVRINHDSTIPDSRCGLRNAVAEGFHCRRPRTQSSGRLRMRRPPEGSAPVDQGEARGFRTQAGRLRAGKVNTGEKNLTDLNAQATAQRPGIRAGGKPPAAARCRPT